MKVVIAGGGIGGLTAALALHQRGVDVQVYESVRRLEPLGVGINILPFSMAVLRDLGLLDRLLELGLSNGELRFYNRHGQLVWAETRGVDAGYGTPQLSIHRGRLQMVLLDAVVERLGPDAVRTGCGLQGFESGDRSVRIELADRASDTTVHDEADLLIGADGIHSFTRARLHPGEGDPLWEGSLVWRGTTVAPSFLSGRTMIMAGHIPHKFIAYPITAPDAGGRQLINWIAVLDWRSQGLPAREDWTRQGRYKDFLPRFEGWRFDWLDVPALIAGADAFYEFPLVDRDPLPRWTHGRVTLLGDAAHPMYPVGSNGASQAIIDAVTLADALADAGDGGIDAALARYESVRRPATAAIVAANRQQGAERILDLAEERAPDGFTSIDDVFAPGELQSIADSYKQLIGLKKPAAPESGDAAKQN